MRQRSWQPDPAHQFKGQVVVLSSGKRFVGVGIQPKVAERPSVADLGAGRDTVLEAALMQIKK